MDTQRMDTERKTIAIVDYDWADLGIEESLIEDAGLQLISNHAATEDEVIEAARGAEGLVVQYAPITGRVLDLLSGRGPHSVVNREVLSNLNLQPSR